MLAFILRRLAQSIVVMAVVALISFMLFRYVGDPVASLLGQDSRIEDFDELRERLGLNDPFYLQFARFIGNALQGEFGISYRLQQPVSELIISRLPATIELAFASALIALVFGLVLGVFTALKPKSFATAVIMTLSLVGVSLPTFLIGIGLIYVFAVELQWLPSFGRGDDRRILAGWSDGAPDRITGLRSLILPAITLSPCSS
jgi:ABC-type dipeptide/oligopeptide/nickel transport system permease component